MDQNQTLTELAEICTNAIVEVARSLSSSKQAAEAVRKAKEATAAVQDEINNQANLNIFTWSSGRIAKRVISLNCKSIEKKKRENEEDYPLNCLRVSVVVMHTVRDHETTKPSFDSEVSHLVRSVRGLSRYLTGKVWSGKHGDVVRAFVEEVVLGGEATLYMRMGDNATILELTIRPHEVVLTLKSPSLKIREKWDRLKAKVEAALREDFNKFNAPTIINEAQHSIRKDPPKVKYSVVHDDDDDEVAAQ